ncbi:hypothetical protein DPMN_148454 [Dreissena polymorpha]|uniref:Uncharacterized protein n=1 Tax=Dreissena polymorpha TaxID=45954 RepID=A0A9D4J3W4_DREPO|nr:hypothetical protein DPMN_148454 [Dreissena polymorpha]
MQGVKLFHYRQVADGVDGGLSSKVFSGAVFMTAGPTAFLMPSCMPRTLPQSADRLMLSHSVVGAASALQCVVPKAENVLNFLQARRAERLVSNSGSRSWRLALNQGSVPPSFRRGKGRRCRRCP